MAVVAALTIHRMEAISHVISTTYSMRADSLALDLGASLTRKALEEMQTQAASILDAVPPPPPMTTRGATLDVFA